MAELLLSDRMLFSAMNNKGYFLKIESELSGSDHGQMKLLVLPGTLQQTITLLRARQAPNATLVEQFLWESREEFFQHLLDLADLGLCGVIICENDEQKEHEDYDEDDLKQEPVFSLE